MFHNKSSPSSLRPFKTFTQDGRATSTHGQKVTKRHAQFIFYINSILEYLAASAPPATGLLVKDTISECVRKNRAGEAFFQPLRRCIVVSIQRVIGQMHWVLANQYFNSIHQQHIRVTNLKRARSLSKLCSMPLPPIAQHCIRLPESETAALSLFEICELASKATP